MAQAPTGAKMMAASSGSGGVSSEPPAQHAPSVGRSLRRRDRRTREGVNFAALPAADLGDDVGGGAEAIETDTAPSPAMRKDRQPINPAQSSGAAATGSSKPASGKVKAASATA